jgi:cell division initiation protein
MPDTGDLDMPLLPSAEQIRRREFATIRRGYDPDQVREYLFQVAAQVETLERELRGAPKPDRSQMSPGEALAQLAAEAQAQEAAIAKAAPPPPPAIEPPTDRYEQLGQRFARVIEVADQEATRVLDEAKAEADRIMEQARGEADRIRVDAQARAEEARQEASEALVQARREADRIIGGLSERRETLVQQMHEMQSRLLTVANELESAMDDRDETISQAVAERTGPAPAGTEPADPRYEDLWRRRDEPSVEIPDLEPIDLDFGEEPGKD